MNSCGEFSLVADTFDAIPGQCRVVAGIDAKTRFRHYVNIPRMEARLDRLLGDFRWGRMDEIFLGAPAVH